QTQQDVINYLDKVKEHESFGYDDLWRKKILHLAGGKNKGEQDFFIGALAVQKDIAEGIYLGASVKTILKSSPDIQLFDITKDVNDGLLLIQFFGHSSTGTSEIDIGDINNPIMKYNNKGKYPMIIMNGCYAGLIYVGGSLGEDWLLAKDKGAVLFLAHSHLGFRTPLNAYTQNFYNIAFANSIFWGKSIGEIHKETIKQFRYGPFGGIILFRAHAQETNLQGDPAIKLFGAYKPDLYTNDDQLFIHSYDGEPVTAVSDSFAIGIIASNFGKAIPDSFYITIERTFADGSQIIYDTLLYPAVFNRDTLFFMIKSKDPNNFGLNKFKVFLDYTNTIDELNEFNNTGVIEYYMPSSGVMTLFPKEYSIVNSLPITFVAQPATDLLKGYSYYVFQLDTINTFNSPMKKDSTLYSGILAKWITYPKFNVEDSTVFYWRVRFRDIPAGEDTLWAESSFIYIPGSPEGWSQSHFPQFSKADLVNVERNIALRRWEFVKNTVDIKLQVFGNKMPDSTELTLNGKLKIAGQCPINGLLAVIFDERTAFPFNADQGFDYYCGFTAPHLLRKLVNLSNPADFNNYFNSIDDSTYILIFSKGDAQYSTWPLEIFISLLNIGASSIIYQLKDGEPYILLGKKGAGYGNALLEVVADPGSGFPLDSQQISIDTSLTGSFYSGTITSTIIGPASDWGTLYHTYKKTETSDNFRLELFGIDLSNKQYPIHDNVTNNSLDLSWIEPDVYPYLRLQATVSDSINFTPPQLKKWQVVYNGVAEGII
ncbi:MAG: hypothetical protein IIA88_11135, partial [Bacteroidetes bacterium]|nr:hypothetical protein [Bacteroidota bacterium]